MLNVNVICIHMAIIAVFFAMGGLQVAGVGAIAVELQATNDLPVILHLNVASWFAS